MRPLFGTSLALLIALAAPATPLRAQAPRENALSFRSSATNYGQFTLSGKFTWANDNTELTSLEVIALPVLGGPLRAFPCKVIDPKKGTWGPVTATGVSKGSYFVYLEATFTDRTNPKRPVEKKVASDCLSLFIGGDEVAAPISPLRCSNDCPKSQVANTISANGTYSGTPDIKGPMKMLVWRWEGGPFLSIPLTLDEKKKKWTAPNVGGLEGGKHYNVLILMKFADDPSTYATPLTSLPVMKAKKK